MPVNSALSRARASAMADMTTCATPSEQMMAIRCNQAMYALSSSIVNPMVLHELVQAGLLSLVITCMA